MTPITKDGIAAMGFRLRIEVYGMPDAIQYTRDIADIEVGVLFGNDGSVEVALCGTYRTYIDDIACVSLPTVTTMERLRMLVAALSTE